jgi:hypothetical protein
VSGAEHEQSIRDHQQRLLFRFFIHDSRLLSRFGVDFRVRG